MEILCRMLDAEKKVAEQNPRDDSGMSTDKQL